jgi:hypothetical protein
MIVLTTASAPCRRYRMFIEPVYKVYDTFMRRVGLVVAAPEVLGGRLVTLVIPCRRQYAGACMDGAVRVPERGYVRVVR